MHVLGTQKKHTLLDSEEPSVLALEKWSPCMLHDLQCSWDFALPCGLCRRRQWHPTPVLLLGKSHGQRSLVGCSPWCREESDMTERLYFHFSLSCIGEGNGNPLQWSSLENPRDSGAYGVAQSRTQLTQLSSSSSDLCVLKNPLLDSNPQQIRSLALSYTLCSAPLMHLTGFCSNLSLWASLVSLPRCFLLGCPGTSRSYSAYI